MFDRRIELDMSIRIKTSARKSKTNVGTISENYLPRRNNSHGTKILEDRES